MSKISILGSGRWGTAIALLLAKNNPAESILLWGRNHYHNRWSIDFPSNIEFTIDLAMAVHSSRYLVIAIASSGFVELIKKIKSYIQLDLHVIVWLTKGMDNANNTFFHQTIYQIIGKDLPIAILSGPSFAKEVIDHLPTAVVMACELRHESIIHPLIKKLSSEYFRIDLIYDLIGIQLGGIYKNILAVVVGIGDGLNLGANFKAALITKGVNELLQISQALGANYQTIFGLAGIGDLLLTCSDNQSRNRQFGMLLAKGYSIAQAKLQIGQAIEALDNVMPLYQLLSLHHVNIPIVTFLVQLLQQSMALKETILAIVFN